MHLPESDRIALEAEDAAFKERLERDYRHNGPHELVSKQIDLDRGMAPKPCQLEDYPWHERTMGGNPMYRLSLWPPRSQRVSIYIGPDYERDADLHVYHHPGSLEDARSCVAAWADFWTTLTGEVYDAESFKSATGADIRLKPLFED